MGLTHQGFTSGNMFYFNFFFPSPFPPLETFGGFKSKKIKLMRISCLLFLPLVVNQKETASSSYF